MDALECCGSGKWPDSGKSPKVVRRGCKRSFGTREQKFQKGLLHHQNLVLLRCNPAFNRCKRDLARLHPKAFCTLSQPLWGDFLDPVICQDHSFPTDVSIFLCCCSGAEDKQGASEVGFFKLARQRSGEGVVQRNGLSKNSLLDDHFSARHLLRSFSAPLVRGAKKPININNFAGLSRKWVGVKLFMCFPFLREKAKQINKIPRKFQEKAGTVPGQGSARPNPKMGAPEPESPLVLGFSVLRGGFRPWSWKSMGRGRSGDCDSFY